jgi:peptide-methionine (S)-S-oxide reductase
VLEISLSAHYIALMNAMIAIFAGGCFWCMQPEFDNTVGVIKTEVGYTGGASTAPTYENHKGHVEAIQITYDPKKISYPALLKIYWSNIDPFDDGGQFADRGDSYKTVIFYADEKEKSEAENSKEAISKKFDGRKVATEIRPRMPFYIAEDYHQKYYEKNATRYKMYKVGSGRVKKLDELWGGDE